MSFLQPLALIGLVGVPLLAVVYLTAQRQRRLAAAAFAAPHLGRSVTPRRPGSRRHLPVIAFALALIALVIAAARPAHTIAVPVKHATIVLATDVSSSMASTDVAPTRLAAAKRAAQQFANRAPAGFALGLVAFNQKPMVLLSPTTGHGAVAARLAPLSPRGGTATGDAIKAAMRLVTSQAKIGGQRPPGAIVLLSDGNSTHGSDPQVAARAAKKAKIPIYTVALGTASGTITVPQKGGGTKTEVVPPSPQTMAAIAKASGGQTFTAANAARLQAVYDRIGYRLGHKREKRELTEGFAGAGLVLVALGSLMTLRWFGRLI